MSSVSGGGQRIRPGGFIGANNGITPLIVDAILDLNQNPALNTQLDATVLGNGTRGTGITWSVAGANPAKYYVGNVASPLIRPVSVNGVLSYGNSSLGLQLDNTADNQQIKATFGSGKASLSIGFFFLTTMGPAVSSFNAFDFTQFKTNTGKDGYLNYQDKAANNWALQNEATSGGSTVTQVIYNLPSQSLLLWIAQKYICGNPGSMRTQIYNGITKALLGDQTISSDAAATVSGMWFGQNRSGTASKFTNWSNILFDWTNAVFPLLPWTT